MTVTGAGDTAIAVLALSLAAGAPLLGAARADCQCGRGRFRRDTWAPSPLTATVSAMRWCSLPDAKVLSREDLAARATSWRLAGKRIVFTNGCFDLLHAGHLSLLNGAAKQGDVLVLAINSDASVRRLKGAERPLVPQAERATMLAALACVDAVTIFDEDTPLEALKSVRPHVLVKGADYRYVEEVVDREFVEA